jgi:hypothetical protein
MYIYIQRNISTLNPPWILYSARREKISFTYFSMVFNFLHQTYTLAASDDKKLCVCKCVHEFFCEREQRERRKYQMKYTRYLKKKKFLLSRTFFRACNFVLNFPSFHFFEGEKGRVKRLTKWKILQFFEFFY